jgi:hypothetical protein
MPNMTAGMLDHRNIGSNISFIQSDGGVVSGNLAIVVQRPGKTELVLAHDEHPVNLPATAEIEVTLPAAAAYTLHLKNAVEGFLARECAAQ